VPCGRDASFNRGYSFIGRKLVQLFSIVVSAIVVPSIIVPSIIVPSIIVPSIIVPPA
jgi:hypothetical protein